MRRVLRERSLAVAGRADESGVTAGVAGLLHWPA